MNLDYCKSICATIAPIPISLGWCAGPLGIALIAARFDSGHMLCCVLAGLLSLALCMGQINRIDSESWPIALAGILSILSVISVFSLIGLNSPANVGNFLSATIYSASSGGMLGVVAAKSVENITFDGFAHRILFILLTIPLCLLYVAYSPENQEPMISYALVACPLISLACLGVAAMDKSISRSLSHSPTTLRQSFSPSSISTRFVIMGLGIPLYTGVPFMISYDTNSLFQIPSPWINCVLALCLISCLIIYFGILGNMSIAYGLIIRRITPILTLLALLSSILLSRNALVGAAVAAIPISISFGVGLLIVKQAYLVNNGEKIPEEILSFIRMISVGIIFGVMLLAILWTIEEEALRFQMLSLLLVATCISQLSSMPKSTAFADALLLETYPEDLSKEKRKSDALAKIALKAKLTVRESQVVGLLVEGMSQKEVAHSLGIRLATAQTHIANLYSKLDVHSVGELISLVSKEEK